jgi:3-methyladenine DNA glycosylase AlkD
VNGLTRRIVDAFEPARDPVAAAPMARYMRDQFEFLGIGSPARRALQREALTGVRPDRDALLAGADSLWNRREREYQ